MVGEKFERIGRADVAFLAESRVASHFLDRVLSDANLTVFHRPESFDPIVEEITQTTAEAVGLLVSEISEVERRILKLPSESRPPRLTPACP